jgi:hypothetical protein
LRPSQANVLLCPEPDPANAPVSRRLCTPRVPLLLNVWTSRSPCHLRSCSHIPCQCSLSHGVQVCTGCGEQKALEDFKPDKRALDGLRQPCRLCFNAAEQERRRRRGAVIEPTVKRKVCQKSTLNINCECVTHQTDCGSGCVLGRAAAFQSDVCNSACTAQRLL